MPKSRLTAEQFLDGIEPSAEEFPAEAKPRVKQLSAEEFLDEVKPAAVQSAEEFLDEVTPPVSAGPPAPPIEDLPAEAQPIFAEGPEFMPEDFATITFGHEPVGPPVPSAIRGLDKGEMPPSLFPPKETLFPAVETKEKPLVDPWFDPLFIIPSGAVGSLAARAAGKGVAKSVAYGLGTAAVALPTEMAAGLAADVVADEHPLAAFGLNIGISVLSPATFERMVSKGMYGTWLGTTKIALKTAEEAGNTKIAAQIGRVMNKADEALVKANFIEPPAKRTARKIFQQMKAARADEAAQKLTREEAAAAFEVASERLSRVTQRGSAKSIQKAARKAAVAARQLQDAELAEAAWTTYRAARNPSMAYKILGKSGRALARATAMTQGAAVTAPVAGLYGGIDWDTFEETGELKFDYKNAAISALVIGGGTAAAVKSLKVIDNIEKKWDKKIATPFLNSFKEWAKTQTKIHAPRVAYGLGFESDPKFKDLMRRTMVALNRADERAIKIANEINEIAPTATAQRRMTQIIQGSAGASAEMKRKAEKFNKLFAEARKIQKELGIARYSMFDKLTRNQRAAYRLIGDNAAKIDTPEALETMRRVGMDDYADQITILSDKLKTASPQQQEQIMNRLERVKGEAAIFAKQRLKDYYHVGSTKEYIPRMYDIHNMTPKKRKDLEEFVKELKKQRAKITAPDERQADLTASQLEELEAARYLDDLIATAEEYLGKKSKAALREFREKLDLGYTHRRQDIPEELQRLMGRIDEAAYPVAKGMTTQFQDVIKAKTFQEIANNPNWVKTKPEGLMKNYHLVQDKRFGALNGKYVRKDIWNDLREVEEWRSAAIQLFDKYQGLWKYGKVVLNPATQARNFVGNLWLAFYGDVNPVTDMPVYAKAFDAIRQKEANVFYREAKDFGLYDNTFRKAELGRLRDELNEIRNPQQLRSWIRKGFEFAGDVYQKNEEFFKTAVFIKARQDGLSVEEAGKKAQKYLFDYSDIPPLIKWSKRWWNPFITWAYKSKPLLAEMAFRKPFKVALSLGAMQAVEEYSKKKLGISEEEAKRERALLPKWMQTRLGVIGPRAHILMPFKDKWGNNLYLDASYFLYGDALQGLVPSAPYLRVPAALVMNRDPFTGREIAPTVYLQESETVKSKTKALAKVLQKYIDFAYKEIAPPMAPGGYGFEKLKVGLQNALSDEKKVMDWAGRPYELSDAIMSALLGIKLSPADEETLLKYYKLQMNKVARKAGEEISDIKRQMRRNEISHEEGIKKISEIKTLSLQIRKEKLEAAFGR